MIFNRYKLICCSLSFSGLIFSFYSKAQVNLSQPLNISSTADVSKINNKISNEIEKNVNKVVDLNPIVLTQADITRLRLIRLWGTETKEQAQYLGIKFKPLDQNSNVNLNDQIQQDRISNESRYLKAKYCGSKAFFSFSEDSTLISDETQMISNVLALIKPNKIERAQQTLKKQMRKRTEDMMRFFSKEKSDYYTDTDEKMLSEIIKENLELKEIVDSSTSLVSVQKMQSQDIPEYLVRAADFTIGGWFRSDLSDTSHSSVFTKFYSDTEGNNRIKEWELFSSGNNLYFHSYRFGTFSVPKKYLSNEEADSFRYENKLYYRPGDYYADAYERHIKEKYERENRNLILQHQNYQSQLDRMRLDQVRSKNIYEQKYEEPILPPKKGDVSKPPIVVRPPSPYPPMPTPPPPLPPYPPLEPPQGPHKPWPPVIYLPEPPLVFGWVQPSLSGKDHTLAFDLKSIYWGYQLGRCYECFRFENNRPLVNSEKNWKKIETSENVKSHVFPTINGHYMQWHYLSISVTQNDRLGPYVDLWFVADPKPNLRKSERTHRIDFKSHLKHIRLKRDNNEFSYLVFNPFLFSHEIESTCDSNEITCVNSKLIIGANSGKKGFSGLMTGLFMAKKAFREKEVVEIAEKLYPNSDGNCGND